MGCTPSSPSPQSPPHYYCHDHLTAHQTHSREDSLSIPFLQNCLWQKRGVFGGLFKLQIDVGPSAVPPKQPGKRGGEERDYSALRAHKGRSGCTVNSRAAQSPYTQPGRGVWLHNYCRPHRATYPSLPAGGTGARLPTNTPMGFLQEQPRLSLGQAISLDGGYGVSREGESCTSDQSGEPNLLPHPKQVAGLSRTAPHTACCHTWSRGW